MKKSLAIGVLLFGSMQNLIYSSDTSAVQEVISQESETEEFIFDEPLPELELEELPANIVIAPTKRSFSIKDVPFYTKLFFSYLFERQLKLAYVAVVGFVTGNKK